MLYAGKAGTGYTEKVARELREKLDPLVVKTTPPAVPVKKPKATWVRPIVDAEIEYGALTDDGLLREAVFKGLRDDVALPGVHTPARSGRGGVPRENILQLLPDAVAPSKDELAAYWRKVAKRALPYLGRRPLKLVRHTRGTIFYHKGALPPIPESVHQLRIEKREGGEGVRVWVDSLAGLLASVVRDHERAAKGAQGPWPAPPRVPAFAPPAHGHAPQQSRRHRRPARAKPTKLRNRASDLRDLGLGVRPGIARMRDQPIEGPVFEEGRKHRCRFGCGLLEWVVEHRAGRVAVKLPRRDFLRLAAGTATLPAVSPIARAQTYPTRAVTLIVFVAAGATPDIIARLIGQSLSQRLGQSVVIDNRPGGGGNLALQAVARAPADGYTLLLVATPHAVNATLYEKSTFTVTRDIVPVASINSDSFALLVNPSFPAKTVPEFITYAKANPGKINLASNGTGNLTHLSGELFRMMTGIEVVHVPYRGTPAAGLITGDVHAMFDAVGSAVPHIQSGALRALGVTSAARLRVLPDIPPISDAVPGYAVSGWLGIGVPKGTPPEIVERLNREVNAALADPPVRSRMADLGSDPLPGSAVDFAKLIAEETEKWGKVIRSANIKAD